MIKLCSKSITLPLSFIFQSILNDGVFPDDLKTVILYNVIKRTVKAISFLPIFSKVFERLTYNSLYNCFMKNKLFLSASLALCSVIHLSHSYYQSLMKFTNYKFRL